MSDELVLDFTPDPRREAAARWRWVVMPVRGVVAGLVGLAGLFVVVVHLLIMRPTPLLWLGIALMVASVALFAVWWAQNRRISGETRRTRVVLDDRGIASHGRESRSALAWERFERWLENDEEFLVLSRVGRERGVTVLPKAGTTDDDQRAVRELLIARVESDEEPLDDAFVEEDDDDTEGHDPTT